jgi:hypothetical protein
MPVAAVFENLEDGPTMDELVELYAGLTRDHVRSLLRIRRPQLERTRISAMMLILFDQGTAVAIAEWFREHTVKTTLEQGWDTLVNGDLLKAAEAAGFNLLLTTDNNMAYQQNFKTGRLRLLFSAATSGDCCGGSSGSGSGPPGIRFWCSTLPSAPASRRRRCASLTLDLHQVG